MLRRTRIKTEIPGPNSRALMRRREAIVPRGAANVTPVFISEAEGALLTDVDGNTFIDFAGGIGAMNVGHADPRVVEAVKEQAERFTHNCFGLSPYEVYVELAEKLCALVPGDFEKKSWFANSGAEAIENAVKISRAHTGRRAILAFGNAFHGRTLLTMSLTGKAGPFREGFGPFAPEAYVVPAPYPYRCPASEDCSSGCRGACFGLLEEVFAGGVDPEDVAAVVVEPVTGEGGFIPLPASYLRRLRELCDRHGILMIADEVQSGFGRTGRMFGIEHSGVVPDLVVTSKSLAGGLPLSAVTGRAQIMDSVSPGGLGSTFGGNPLACAAALAVLQTFEQEGLLERARRLGERVMITMEELKYEHEIVGDARGLGPMAAIEIVSDAESRAPDATRTARIVEHALREGLLLITAGQHGNVVRTMMPLVIADEELEEGLATLRRAVASASGAA